MYCYSDIRLRKFTYEDIPLKIQWVNDSQNNTYLHYDLPLEYEKTCQWYERNKDNANRFDAVIEYKGTPVGLIGLLNIDIKNRKAEEYIMLGDPKTRGKGIAKRAGILNTIKAFDDYALNKIYIYTEAGNENARAMYLSRKFHVEGYLKHDLWVNGRTIDRFVMSLYRENFVVPDGVFKEI